jgi:uncharacterized protein involved in cysteine biosynthesis
MNDNPYASSSKPNAEELGTEPPIDETLLGIARNVFLAWEKLRVLYLGILTLLVLLLVGFSGILNLSLMISIVFGAFFANVFYFAGPVVDTYIRWLGYRNSWPRWVMFIGGTILSIVLAIGLLGSHLLPNQP